MLEKEKNKVRTILSFDKAIKKPLRLKSNFAIMEGFLSELLKRNIRIIEIIEGGEDALDDEGISFIVKSNRNEPMLVEIQYRTELDYPLLMLYSLNQKMHDYGKQGQRHGRLKRAFSIALLFMEDVAETGRDYIYHGKPNLQGVNENETIELTADSHNNLFDVDPYGNLLHEYYVLITENYDNLIRDTLDEWIYYIKNSKVRDGFTAKGMKELRERLDVEKLKIKD